MKVGTMFLTVWLLIDLKFQVIISNHVTYLDNVAIETIIPSVMVSIIIIVNNRLIICTV